VCFVPPWAWVSLSSSCFTRDSSLLTKSCSALTVSSPIGAIVKWWRARKPDQGEAECWQSPSRATRARGKSCWGCDALECGLCCGFKEAWLNLSSARPRRLGPGNRAFPVTRRREWQISGRDKSRTEIDQIRPRAAVLRQEGIQKCSAFVRRNLRRCWFLPGLALHTFT
jgi:hypothetical protein